MSHKKFNPEKAERLLSPQRYQELKPDILLQRLGVAPGSTLLDLGCGNGFFTFPAAAAMGDSGMVIAADMSAQMLGLLERRVPPDNVQVLEVEEVNLDIEDNSVDACVAITLFHEFKNPQENLSEIRRTLTGSGKLLILDWDSEASQERGPSHEHRVSLQQASKQVEDAGYRIEVAESYISDMWMIIAGVS